MAEVTRLRLHVLNTGLPAYVVAHQAGVHPTKLAKYMKGHLELVGTELNALSHYLKCNSGDLVGWVELGDLLSVGASS